MNIKYLKHIICEQLYVSNLGNLKTTNYFYMADEHDLQRPVNLDVEKQRSHTQFKQVLYLDYFQSADKPQF